MQGTRRIEVLLRASAEWETGSCNIIQILSCRRSWLSSFWLVYAAESDSYYLGWNVLNLLCPVLSDQSVALVSLYLHKYSL